MRKYGEAAVRARQLILEYQMSPVDAWKAAITRLTESQSSQAKSCPKSTFIGLCAAGLIAGIPASDFSGKRNKNAEYAMVAWGLLQAEPHLGDDPSALWARVTAAVPNSAVNHNGQMDVVLHLWRDCYQRSLAP